MANLRDAYILQDFTVWIDGVGKIGVCPSFQTPEIKIQTEEFRGGGMDGTVEIPFGIEKIEFDFEMHSYDPQIWHTIGYGPNSIDVPVWFRGYLVQPSANVPGGGTSSDFGGQNSDREKSVLIQTSSLIREIRPGKSEPGRMTTFSVTVVANWYRHVIAGKEVMKIDVFNKQFVVNGVDRNRGAVNALGLNAGNSTRA